MQAVPAVPADTAPNPRASQSQAAAARQYRIEHLMRRRALLQASALLGAGVPLLSACKPFGGEQPSPDPEGTDSTSTASTDSTDAPQGPETPQPTSSTEARTAPTEFSVSPGLPSLDVDMLADEGAWWSLSDRYIFRGSSPTWWYGDLSTGTYRVLQAEGSSPSFSEIASAADLPSGGEPVGPTRQLAYDAATAAPDGVFAYSATTTVRSGSAQAVSWELTVLKIDLQAGRVVTSRSMTMPAEVESTIGNVQLAVSADSSRVSLAAGMVSGPCRVLVLSAEDLSTLLEDPQPAVYGPAALSGDYLLAGMSSKRVGAPPADPPYDAISLKDGSVAGQYQTGDCHLFGTTVYSLIPQWQRWQIVDLSTGAEIEPADPIPTGTVASRPKVWATGGYTVVRSDDAVDIRPLGDSKAALAWTSADRPLPTAAAVYDDVLYTIIDSTPGEVSLTDLQTGQELGKATLPETFQAGEGTLEVTHEGIGRFINPGSSVFYSATAWRS